MVSFNRGCELIFPFRIRVQFRRSLCRRDNYGVYEKMISGRTVLETIRNTYMSLNVHNFDVRRLIEFA